MRKAVLLSYILIIVFILSACVPTPEEEAIVYKDQQKMIEQAQATNTNRSEKVDLYEQLGAPREYKQILSSNEDRLTVTVDAQVVLPNKSLPIVRVRPVDFTMDQILTFCNALVSPGSHFVDKEASKSWSKKFYNREIQKLLWAIDHWNDGGSRLYDMQYYSVDEAKEGLSKLLIEQSNAPDSLPLFNIEEVTVANGFPEAKNLVFYSTKDDEEYATIMVVNRIEDLGYAGFFYLRDQFGSYLSGNNNCHNRITFSHDDAMAEANSLMEKLSTKDFFCAASFLTEYNNDYLSRTPCYHFIFTRKFNGVCETATISSQMLDQYDKPWGYEMIHIIVDEKGIAGFQYDNPYVIDSILSEETNLLPFSDIQQVFEKRITVYNNEFMNDASHSSRREYCITTIRLGLVNIKEENAETGLLVPAWDFLGYIHYQEADGNERYADTNELHPFLTINAIDGSIINRSGY